MGGDWDSNEPYQDLPELPPSAELKTVAVLTSLVGAKAQLMALDEACRLMTNPAILINAIPLLEAQSSSEIENIVTTTDELFRYSIIEEGSGESTAAKETLRYRAALHAGFKNLQTRPLSINTAIEICSEINGKPMSIRDLPGTKIANPATGSVLYTPPSHPDVIRNKLANWERFIHEADEIDPLVRMAVAHYQFEAIHPFFDGNGRTGRILNILTLVQLGLLRLPVLYLSRFILDNKSEYYQRLTEVTSSEEWEAWTIYMLDAVASTASWTRSRIHKICDLQSELTEFVKERAPSVYRHELIEVIFEQPYCRIENIVNRQLATRQTSANWLRTLVEIGVLHEVSAGRHKLFINHRLVDLLTN